MNEYVVLHEDGIKTQSYQNSIQGEAQFSKESLPELERGGKGVLLITVTERTRTLTKWNSYLVIDWYHKVSVDRGTIRLIFQGTLFSVQFDLWQKKHNLLNSAVGAEVVFF